MRTASARYRLDVASGGARQQHDDRGRSTVHLSFCTLLVGALAIVGTAACGERAGESTRDTFVVKAGVMEPAGAGVDHLRETQRITMDPSRRPGWCFLVDPPNDRMYEVHSVTYLPSPPRHLTGDFAGQSEVSTGLRSATSRVDGIRPFCFDFDPGDPLGEYRVEIFINGERHSELRMQVVE